MTNDGILKLIEGSKENKHLLVFNFTNRTISIRDYSDPRDDKHEYIIFNNTITRLAENFKKRNAWLAK